LREFFGVEMMRNQFFIDTSNEYNRNMLMILFIH